MKDFRLLDAARKARDSAAAAATDLGRQASDKAESLKAKAADVKEQIAEQASEMTDLGLSKLNETMTEFNASLPVLREAGYTIDGVTIKLGMPPKIVANFSGGASVPEEKVRIALEAGVLGDDEVNCFCEIRFLHRGRIKKLGTPSVAGMHLLPEGQKVCRVTQKSTTSLRFQMRFCREFVTRGRIIK